MCACYMHSCVHAAADNAQVSHLLKPITPFEQRVSGRRHPPVNAYSDVARHWQKAQCCAGAVPDALAKAGAAPPSPFAYEMLPDGVATHSHVQLGSVLVTCKRRLERHVLVRLDPFQRPRISTVLFAAEGHLAPAHSTATGCF